MSLANDIIHGRKPAYHLHLQQGESLDDIDEYGFTPLIEAVIVNRQEIVEELLEQQVDINKQDVGGRTALHWAVDNGNQTIVDILLRQGANPNAYTTFGMPILVYPLLRNQTAIKHLLYQYNARLDFALDFINAKLIGHRFELKGDVDILTAQNEFIVLDYEGFMLEFTVAALQDSLRRFLTSYSTRHLRGYFSTLQAIMHGFEVASALLRFQQHPFLSEQDKTKISHYLETPLLILPAASRGHAMCFIRYRDWWAKIDRGENSLKEGSINIYKMAHPGRVNLKFIVDFLYARQRREFFHQEINSYLGLQPCFRIPVSSQIAGNCSWANIQAVIPTAYALLQLYSNSPSDMHFDSREALSLYHTWIEWDKDRALQDCLYRFNHADQLRKASIASILASILFQSCDYQNVQHMQRAEKILKVLMVPEYYFILQSYLNEYCVKRLTPRGNNLLKILDDCGINPNINVTPVATALKTRDASKASDHTERED